MARMNGPTARGRRATSPRETESSQPDEAAPSTLPGHGERGRRMSEMIDTEYRLLGAQLRAGRMPAAVKTSKRLTELVDSLRRIQPPDAPHASTARTSSQARQPARRRKDAGGPS